MTMGRACLLAIVCSAIMVSTAVAESEYSDGEVAQKAQDVMEDRRQLLGTFPRLSSEQSLDYLLAHLGQNGLLFVGVFPRDHVDSEDAFHHRRTFEAWEKLAKDQSFLAGFGAPNKNWVFGHTVERELGQAYGCPSKGWNYACILVWKTSVDGTHLSRATPIKFHHEAPSMEDMERALQRVASQRIEPHDDHDEL